MQPRNCVLGLLGMYSTTNYASDHRRHGGVPREQEEFEDCSCHSTTRESWEPRRPNSSSDRTHTSGTCRHLTLNGRPAVKYTAPVVVIAYAAATS